MARVFISHASSDSTFAERIHRELADLGHQAFLARDIRKGIRVGDLWKDRLHQELRAADAVICVLTDAYNASPWCAYEIGIAHEVGSLLLPLRSQPGVTSPLLDDRQHVVAAVDDGWIGDLDVALRRVDASGGLGWAWERSPFPGLSPFTRDMARVFYGRDDELRRLTHRLRALSDRRLLLVVGGSGCGKSSLVGAGLAARLGGEAGWLVAEPFVPGRDPVRKLALALAKAAETAGAPWDAPDALRRLRGEPSSLATLSERLLDAVPGPPRDRLLLVVDQGEELFTRTGPEDRSHFAAVLSRGLDGPIRVVIAVRSEFQDQLFAVPELRDAHLHAFPLRPLGRDMLHVVITEPARVAGLAVDPELVGRMVEETADGEALPLLAFTLHELARGQTRGGRLSERRYDELGGVRGALARRADAVLDEAVATSRLPREDILASMTELATLDEAGRRTRRRIDLDELSSAALRTALGTFVEQRLLSTASDSGSFGGTAVGVVHEALLTAWLPLDAAIRGREAALLAEGQVERAAAEWARGADGTSTGTGTDGPANGQVNGQEDHALWGTDRLRAATTILWGSHDRFRAGAEPAVNLNRLGRQFLAACNQRAEDRARRDRARRRRITIGLSLLLALAVLGGVTTYWQADRARAAQQAAEDAQRAAISRALLTSADGVRDTDPTLALRLGIAAAAIGPHAAGGQPDPASRANLLQSLATDPAGLASRGDPVTAVAFSPRSDLLAAGGADASVQLWTVVRGQTVALGPPLTGLRGPVDTVAFTDGGRTLTATDTGGHRQAWDIGTRTRPRPLGITGTSNTGTSNTGTSSTGTSLGDPRVARVGQPGSPVTIEADGRDLRAGRAQENGQSGVIDVTAVGDDGGRRPLGQIRTDTGSVRALAFSPDGSILASADSGDGVRLWHAVPAGGACPAGAAPATPTSVPTPGSPASEPSASDPVTSDPVRSGPVTSGGICPVGEPLRGHRRSVLSLAFSPDGTLLASGAYDGSIRLWSLDPVADFLTGGIVARACRVAGGGLDASSWQFYVRGLPFQRTCPR
ncbi:WD40 repeat-containing protein [Frankia canadensis]|uniref:WD40 repeat-containing protein n=1 Tax=Frankia canadensis TaxID=1836972 RepID=A0A2I2KXF2_9ACTN|nr:TIR domain-containing protein [Frankia canadensis]SNQ50340.1 WD40 repeat-containing protein [Frankia canadensis]SOU57630.1 WD40 repeat-containing protein [Frankia canadensis]